MLMSIKAIQQLLLALRIDLSLTEQKIIYVASFFHDIGMLPTRDDLEFIRLNRNKKHKFIARMNDIRNNHANKSRLTEQIGTFREGLNSLFGQDSAKVDAILLCICSAHTDKSDTALGDLPVEDRLSDDVAVRTLLLGSLLRYGDELDVGKSRALPFEYYELNVIPDDQQTEHVKHLAIEKVVLSGEASSVLVTFEFDAAVITNIQVLRNISNFMKKVEAESCLFEEMLSRYKPGVAVATRMLGANREEIDQLFAKVEDLKLISSYPNKDHYVIRFSEDALAGVYELKKVCTSHKLKFLIVTGNGADSEVAYQRRGANMLSSLDLSKEIPRIVLKKRTCAAISTAVMRILNRSIIPTIRIYISSTCGAFLTSATSLTFME